MTTPKERVAFYASGMPVPEELVMVRVTAVENAYVKVELLAYGLREAYIPLKELSSRRIRNIHSIVQVGKEEVCMVTDVDVAKGYIDVSRRNVSTEDIEQCRDRYKKAVQAHHMLWTVAQATERTLDSMYRDFAWPWMDTHDASLHQLFMTQAFDHLPDDVVAAFRAVVQRLKPAIYHLKQKVHITCFSHHGIDAIKATIREGLQCAQEPYEVKIMCVSSPVYLVHVSGPESEGCDAMLTRVVDGMKAMMATFDDGDVHVYVAVKDEDVDKAMAEINN
jgi:translation initiation factor 2 subunit 1